MRFASSIFPRFLGWHSVAGSSTSTSTLPSSSSSSSASSLHDDHGTVPSAATFRWFCGWTVLVGISMIFYIPDFVSVERLSFTTQVACPNEQELEQDQGWRDGGTKGSTNIRGNYHNNNQTVLVQPQLLPPPPMQPQLQLQPQGYVRYPKVFGHVHMAKTAGTEINGELAAHFERVCGHKGYSYDSYQFNQRARTTEKLAVKKHGDEADLISKVYPGFNRGRVQFDVMAEIGYEDCDYISLEQSAAGHVWEKLSQKFPMELHVPCRSPLDHFMSQCNFQRHVLDCNSTKLGKEVEKCLVKMDRFVDGMKHIRNTTLKCFDPIPIENYVTYMGQWLQRKRLETTYIHRDTNKPRNRATECIWSDPAVQDRVLKLLMRKPYYKFCDHCMGTKNELSLK